VYRRARTGISAGGSQPSQTRSPTCSCGTRRVASSTRASDYDFLCIEERNMPAKDLILDFSEYDLNRVIADIEEIRRWTRSASKWSN
jgi:hypothetical protein